MCYSISRSENITEEAPWRHEATADRLTGVLIGAACADALGAGYEFGGPVPADRPVTMRGQGPFEPGEWTDDTAQLLAIAIAAADGRRPADDRRRGRRRRAAPGLVPVAGAAEGHRHPLRRRLRRGGDPADARTRRAVPRRRGGQGGSAAGQQRRQRRAHAHRSRRDGPVAAIRTRMVRAAMRLASMTHADDLSSQACAVWCLAIRAALLTRGPVRPGGPGGRHRG